MLKGMLFLEVSIMCSIAVKNTLFRTFCTPMYTCGGTIRHRAIS